jgi:hypothetical protein
VLHHFASRLVCTAALAGVLLVASGCGSSSNSGSTTARAGFTTRANAICADAKAKISSIVANAPPLSATSQAAAYLSRVVAAYDSARSRLARVTPPADLSSRYHVYLRDLTGEIGLLRSALAGARAGSSARIEAPLRRGVATAGQVRAQARAIGLDACATPIQPPQP